MTNPSETAGATPRTDATITTTAVLGDERSRYYVPIDFARQLERELTAIAAENERLKRELGAEQYMTQHVNMPALRRAESELSRVKAALERDRDFWKNAFETNKTLLEGLP